MAEILERFEAGALSPEIAVMELLLASQDAAQVAQLLDERTRTQGGAGLVALRRLLAEHYEQAQRLTAMLGALPADLGPGSVEQRLACCRELFDALVAASEEASVALYSLGSPAILAAATREVVDFLAGLEVLSPAARVLDLGCGIGRLELALAARVAELDGVDLSPSMVQVAQRRCAGLANVHIALSNGRDLAEFGARSKELVLAVDSFPYVVQAGPELVDAMAAEIARVLSPGGLFVVLNFSYRGDLARDREDVAELARRQGFALELDGEQPFTLWNGTAFTLRRVERVEPGR